VWTKELGKSVYIASLLRRGFNELYMALTVSNRCVKDAQAEITPKPLRRREVYCSMVPKLYPLC
jgi:hypothetical protein